MTIVDSSTYNPATNSNFTGMPTGLSDYLWTSTEYGEDSSLAIAFNPYYGWYNYVNKTATYQIMCVSGNELTATTSADFTTQTINGSVVVTDSRTALMWQKEYEIYYTWQQALKYCEDLNYAGYSDWRLPNKNELASLLDQGKSGKLYSNFPNMPSNSFWSSSTYVIDTSYAWYVGFNYGNISHASKTNSHSGVKCVRSYSPSQDNNTRTDTCTGLPANAQWNTASSITQNWNGSSWQPSTSGVYNENPSSEECRFKCNTNYSWTGTACVAPTQQTATCTGLPANAQWNTASSITQNWNGSEWLPSTTGVYNENPSSEECRFKCYTNYFWNGSNCLNPCESNPCSSVANSTGVCTSQSATTFSCGCKTNYYWNGSNCLARTQTVNCELPRGAQYNTASSITQTWNGSVWVPSATPTYNEEASTTECRYTCSSDYDWDELTQRCVTKGDTRIADCTDLPAHASYNTVSSIEQTYDGLDRWGNETWVPSNTTTYSETPSTTDCYFKCDEGYTYDGSSMCVVSGDTKTAECTELPTGAQWNTVSSITQTWNGSEWTPTNTGSYNETPSTTECRFKCNEEYSYDGSKCVTVGDTKTVNCTGLPTGAQWNTVSSVTQTWNGSAWTPAVNTTGSYNETPSTTECRYICKEHYTEDNGQCVADTQPAYCDEKPENSAWNDDGANGAYTQTWSGSAWSPSYTTSYDETAGACHFTCLSGYIWNGVGCINPCDYCGEHSNGVCTILSTTEYSCGCVENYTWNAITLKCEPPTQTYTCTGKPANSSWNSVSSYTQTWDGSAWTPAASEATYNEEASTTECRFKCNTNYFWNGSACINVCDENPCNGKANSTKVCKPTSATEYICGCNNSYFWNGSQCEDIHNMPECTSSSNTPCTNLEKTLIWSSKSDTTVLSSEATAYCDEFFEGGFEDWSLPTIGELRTLVQNCPATETGGSCGVTDNCLLSSCRDSSCDGCASGSAVYSQLGDTEALWAKNTAYWNIDFTTAKINKGSLLFANIRCVRPGICEFGEVWNGSACASPCDGNPCAGIANSNGTCSAINATEYSCGCNSSYYWNSSTLKCEYNTHCGDGAVQEEYGETCEPASFSSSTCYKPTSEESCGNCGGQVISKYATYQSACNTCGLTWTKISSEDAETDCGGEVPEPRCEF